jgi:F-type H+-transporting ATPase subunit b
MLIDWFTVGAQVLNFVILAGLMKHFLYQPILRALDARETRIEAELADADAKRKEANDERDTLQHKNEAFDAQRSALLAQASEDAQAEKQKLLAEAREEAESLRIKRLAALQSDTYELSQTIIRKTSAEVFAIARKVLADLATTSLEERMSDVLIRRVQNMESEAKQSLAEAFKASTETTLVRSAFELSSEHRAAVQHALNVTFSVDLPLQFETRPDLISGIEMRTSGLRVGWNISEYLALLEKSVAAFVQDEGNVAPREAKVQGDVLQKANPADGQQEEAAP